ncbi:MAG: dienelactone hydrolase family protein [Bryobacteraceae bacterium]
MIEEEIEIPTPDGKCDGVFWRPENRQHKPAVIMLTDIGGIRPANRDLAGRLASEGYAVLMPNLFYRTTKVPVFDFVPNFGEERTKKRMDELRAPLTPDAIERDAAAYVDFAAAHDASGAIGVAGYCFSGSIAMRIAAAQPDKIRVAASFHGGGLFNDAPTSPHLLLPRIKARLYFGHAIEDRSMPAEAIEKFNSALKSWGGEYESEIYESAYHGWTMPDSPVYNQPQAERAYGKLKELLAQTLN